MKMTHSVGSRTTASEAKSRFQCWASNFPLPVTPPNSVHRIGNTENWIPHISRDTTCEGRPWMTGTSPEALQHMLLYGGYFSGQAQKACIVNYAFPPIPKWYDEQRAKTWVHGGCVAGYPIYSHTIVLDEFPNHRYSSRSQTKRWPYQLCMKC